MAQVRNITPNTLWVPEVGKTVGPDEVLTVPAERLEAFIVQTDTWADATKRKKEED